MAKKEKKPRENVELSEKAQAFVTEYLKDYNGTRAAIAAGYSSKAAFVQASTLLTDPRVQAKLATFKEQLKKTAILTFEQRAAILSEIAMGRLSNFVKVSAPGLVAIQATEDTLNSAALSDIDQRVLSENQGGGLITKLKIRDPVAAIQELNRMYGDHAPTRVDARISGTVENMTEAELKEELEQLEQQALTVAAGKGKAGGQ